MMGGLRRKSLFVLLGSIFFLSACHGSEPREKLSDTGALPEVFAESY